MVDLRSVKCGVSEIYQMLGPAAAALRRLCIHRVLQRIAHLPVVKSVNPSNKLVASCRTVCRTRGRAELAMPHRVRSALVGAWISSTFVLWSAWS
jgi:hypothetical protein